MEDQRTSPAMKVLVTLLFLFLLAPVILVVPISFSGDQVLSFPPSNWSMRWYGALFADGEMISAFGTSLWLAAAVTIVSLVAALPAAQVIVRLRTRGSGFLFGLFTAPLLLPTIVLGLALLVVFASMGMLGGLTAIAIGHLVITVPYALRVLVTTLGNIDLAYEEAAATLGAPPITVFRRIVLPMMTPGLIGAGALSFLVSFDEVVITLFLAGPKTATLPVMMFRHVESRADPLVAAISVLLVLLTLVVIMVIDRTVGLARTFVK